MPFTFAHPAITLPFIQLNSKYVSASALVVGSMAPDFEYFFKMAVNSRHGHTFWGLVYFDIPVTIFLLFVFHVLVKRELLNNLPVVLQQKFQHLRQMDFIQYFRRHVTVVVLSSWVGAALHVFWDGFTHSSGYFVEKIYFLKSSFIPFGDLRLPLFFVLQHLSTAIGLFIIAIYIASMKKESTAMVNNPSLFYWFLLFGISGLVIVVRFLIKSSDFAPGNLIVTAISGFCIGLVVLGLRRTYVKK